MNATFSTAPMATMRALSSCKPSKVIMIRNDATAAGDERAFRNEEDRDLEVYKLDSSDPDNEVA